MIDQPIVYTKEINPKLRKEECIGEIKEIINSIGANSVNRNYLAKKYVFDWHTVNGWINSILMATPQEEISLIATKAEQTILKALARCEKIISDPETNTRDKISAINAMNDTLKVQKDILEAYGRKLKVADKVNMNIDGAIDINKMTVAQSFNLIKQEMASLIKEGKPLFEE